MLVLIFRMQLAASVSHSCQLYATLAVALDTERSPRQDRDCQQYATGLPISVTQVELWEVRIVPQRDTSVRQPIFAPLPTGSRTTSVAGALRVAILKGALPPGSPLPEVQIASDLGVSRAPVREALRMLQEEGLVSKESYRGAYVAPVRPELAEEIRSIRLRIEPFAAERSLSVLASEEGSTALESALQQMEELATACADPSAAVDAHMAFHRAFYELADHRLLLETWRSLESGLRLDLLLDRLSVRSARTLVGSHRALLECVRRGDIQAVRSELRAHIASGLHAEPIATASGQRSVHEHEHQQPKE